MLCRLASTRTSVSRPLQARRCSLPQRGPAAADLPQQPADLGHRQRGAVVEGIDIDLVELELHFDDVVARQADAEGGESELCGHVQEDDRQRDRDADACGRRPR